MTLTIEQGEELERLELQSWKAGTGEECAEIAAHQDAILRSAGLGIPDARKIIVAHERNPLPNSDFIATRDEWDLGDKIGFGSTAAAAIEDLLTQEEIA